MRTVSKLATAVVVVASSVSFALPASAAGPANGYPVNPDKVCQLEYADADGAMLIDDTAYGWVCYDRIRSDVTVLGSLDITWACNAWHPGTTPQYADWNRPRSWRCVTA